MKRVKFTKTTLTVRPKIGTRPKKKIKKKTAQAIAELFELHADSIKP